MRLKLDLRGRYAPSATILDTPTRNAPKHLTFPLPLSTPPSSSARGRRSSRYNEGMQ
jgi:hypothetical protein